jgi:glucan-binding YG repeat protein
MKRILSTLILFFCMHSISAEEIVIYQGKASHFNEFLEGMTDAKFAIKYDTEEKIYYFFSSGIMNKGWVKLTETQLVVFRSTLNKYLQWEKTAIEQQVEIKKEFPESALSCDVLWKFGEDWYYSNLTMSFKFFSQSKTRHQFILYSNNVSSSSNEFVDYKIEPFYLDNKHVSDLIDGISEEAIKNIIAEAAKKQEVEDLFK